MFVKTAYGIVQGNKRADGFEFLGIPYAAAPIGQLRLKPPIKPEPWEGVLDCRTYGAAAPQIRIKEIKMLDDNEAISEDCLRLNVYTPAIDDKKRPVMVYIHAGAFQRGSGHVGFISSTYMEKDIVAITVNYRLGALGFLDFTDYLGEEYRQSGNNGILDIIQALIWVKENIQNFGGDPDNVTLFGQSAGAKQIMCLTLMEKAKGLFHKVFAESGGVHSIRDIVTARKITDIFMKDAGLNKENAHELLTMPWEKIVQAQVNLFKGLNLHTCGPVFDGINFCTDNALDIIREGKANMVPVMCGTSRDELQLYYNTYKFHELDNYMAERLFGDNAPIVQEEYRKRVAEKHIPHDHVDFMTEYIYRHGVMQFCREMAYYGNQNVYLFRNDYDKQPIRAGHCSGAQFTMREYGKYGITEHTKEYYRLADAVVDAIASFMRNGKPESSGMPQWPAFDVDERKMMVWDDAGCYVTRSPESYVTADMPEQVFKLT